MQIAIVDRDRRADFRSDALLCLLQLLAPLAQADAALYRAKNAGRNTICTATN
ncbi:hypothetical protein [Pseudothauera lacus]|uniref:hypothetical protein n=1 Tax=Pseudothauera lacus TaxID=2136175 RepID=UPI0015E7A74F|nr:hypothetical protein [Pseudothauera lacus]